MSYCHACGIAFAPDRPACPLCGGASSPAPARFPFPARPPGDAAPYPEASVAAGRIRRRARLERAVRLGATWLSALLVALDLLTSPGMQWAYHPAAALLALWAFVRVPRSLPRPRAGYLVLMGEAALLAWLGATAQAGRSPAWFGGYAFPGIALAGACAVGALTLLRDRPFKKAYAPFLGTLFLALLPLPAALAARTPTDLVFPGILFFLAGGTLVGAAGRARRWLRSELRRKLAR